MPFLATALVAATLTAPPEGLALGMPAEALRVELDRDCDAVTRHEPARAGFPLAVQEEVHWVCDGARSGASERAVFVVADGVLAFATFAGGSASFEPESQGFEMLGYRGWPEAGVVTHPESDTTWWLDADGLHANLFAWRHPLLDAEELSPWSSPTFTAPVEARLGEALEVLAPEIEAACAFTLTRELEPGLPTQPTTQTQIDCFGYPVAGFPRKIEFVFGDGRLELVWILTGRGEEDRLRASLEADHGPAEALIPGFEFFDDRRVALRTDKPELMMASDAVLDAYFGGR